VYFRVNYEWCVVSPYELTQVKHGVGLQSLYCCIIAAHSPLHLLSVCENDFHKGVYNSWLEIVGRIPVDIVPVPSELNH
jgi:hypothetical protein